MPLTSSDVLADRVAAMRELFPEVFTEDGMDFDRLRRELGEHVESGRERYGLSWAGKAEAIRNVQSQSVGALRPAPEESVDFDTTENLFIEGDNLEVLKLLQKSYHGRVKMIYIDPPYNTGNEFIYPDNFREGIEDYLRFSGQKNGEGVKLSTNTETGGRYHSKWLDMMYPRLFLARNLLREDGVIFVSIDDHEVHNLRMLMDEVFGEENFVACVAWQHSIQAKGYLENFSVHHNYIFCYRRSDHFSLRALERTEEHNKNYSNPDNDPRGPWRSGDVRNALYRPNLIFDIETPSGKIINPPEKGWRWSKQTVVGKIESGEIVFSKDETRIVRKIYLDSVPGRAPETIWFGKEVGTTREAATELKNLFNKDTPFDTGKPSRLVRRMMELSLEGTNDELILDFFAGSATTAHAVLDQNNEDGGDRRFIMVQLPEPTENPEYPTIAEIGKERIRRVIGKLDEADTGKLRAEDEPRQDRGFRVFKLGESSFKIWDGGRFADGEGAAEGDMAEQLRAFAENVREDRSQLDILYEILLKAGLPLTAKVEQVEGREVYTVAEGLLVICLEREVTQEIVDEISTLAPERVVCLDTAFHGNDTLKTNARLQLQSRDIEFRTV
ncbi:site-specific DNA-methyltransferase [soil metagenome]